MNKIIQDGEAVKFGWKKTTENLGILIGATFVVSLIMVVLLLICAMVSKIHWTVGFLFFLIFFAASVYLGFGFTKLLLKVVDGQPASFETLFVKDVGGMVQYFLVMLLYSTIVSIGMVLFILPGIIAAVVFMFAPLCVVDKNMNAIEALKASLAMTSGVRWDLIGFLYVVQLVIMIGFAALGIGAVLSVPTGILALIHVYRKLSSQA